MVKHNYSIDLLRGVAAFGIVGCHLMLYPKTAGSCAMTALCDMFVGLFAALSGYWMGAKYLVPGNDADSFFQYALKRARRIIPTYLVWTIVYIVFGLCFDLAVRGGLSDKWMSPGFAIDALFLGGASCHLWFLVCLFYSQVILFMVVSLRHDISWWICIVFGFFLVAIAAYSPAACWWTFYPLRLFAFLITGCGVAKLLHESQKGLSCGWFIAILAGIGMHFAMNGILPQFIRDWLVVVPLLALVAKASLSERAYPFAELLGKSSMGVFLVHPIFAAGLGMAFKGSFASPYGILPWMLDWIVVWGCSLAVALVLVRIPVVRKFSS